MAQCSEILVRGPSVLSDHTVLVRQDFQKLCPCTQFPLVGLVDTAIDRLRRYRRGRLWLEENHRPTGIVSAFSYALVVCQSCLIFARLQVYYLSKTLCFEHQLRV